MQKVILFYFRINYSNNTIDCLLMVEILVILSNFFILYLFKKVLLQFFLYCKLDNLKYNNLIIR